MASYEEIIKQIKNLDSTEKLCLYFAKEIKELPNILWKDEKLERIVGGWYKNLQGILVATNKRVIFVDKGLFYGLRVESFSYDKIVSVECLTGVFKGEIILFATGKKAIIKGVDKEEAKDFCVFVGKHTSSMKEQTSASVAQEMEEGLSVKSKRLVKLKEQRALSTEKKLYILAAIVSMILLGVIFGDIVDYEEKAQSVEEPMILDEELSGELAADFIEYIEGFDHRPHLMDGICITPTWYPYIKSAGVVAYKQGQEHCFAVSVTTNISHPRQITGTGSLRMYAVDGPNGVMRGWAISTVRKRGLTLKRTTVYGIKDGQKIELRTKDWSSYDLTKIGN